MEGGKEGGEEGAFAHLCMDVARLEMGRMNVRREGGKEGGREGGKGGREGGREGRIMLIPSIVTPTTTTATA